MTNNNNVADLSVFESLQDSANVQMGMPSGMAVFNLSSEQRRDIDRFRKDAESLDRKVREFAKAYSDARSELLVLGNRVLLAADKVGRKEDPATYSEYIKVWHDIQKRRSKHS